MAKTLLIVGNGFDLAHGLETSLRCFKCYLKYKDDNTRNFLNEVKKYVPAKEDWSDFEQTLGNIDYDDIRNENSCYIVDPSSDDWRDRYNFEYSYEVDKALAFDAKISTYIGEWIRSVVITENQIFDISGVTDFMSFNYTNTLEIIYGIPKEKICYIHGDCSKGEELICGHNDKKIIGKMNHENEDLSYPEQEGENRIKESCNITWKNPSHNIEKNQVFFNQWTNVDNIIIIGHSFENEIDDDYFVYLKKIVSPNCKWKISWYSESDHNNNDSFATRIGLQKYELFSISSLYKII